MTPLECILHKREGRELPAAAIVGLIEGYTAGRVPDYQLSAFLMAGLLRGFSDGETAALVDVMLHSGTRLDFGAIEGRKIDKHSTGGVGDKVSLVLAPLAAELGVRVPMISGRGLGHTGGTLDKLESIPGFRTDLPVARMHALLDEFGVFMVGQTEDLAPADRKLYALRDVTGTVEFIPYIAASIMSKKLAAGLDGLVLDVKTGSGAFMVDERKARRLAEALCGTAQRYGCPTVALLTSMDAPLGRAVGNWPEVVEAVDTLKGGGPDDLVEVTLGLVAHMLVLAGTVHDAVEGRRRADDVLRSGRAFERFARMVAAQGGDVSALEAGAGREGAAPKATVRSAGTGFVQGVDARSIGQAGVLMGAGRATKEDFVDPFAGIVLNKTVGAPVRKGDVLAHLHGSDDPRVAAAVPHVARAFTIGDAPPEGGPVILDRFFEGSWASETG